MRSFLVIVLAVIGGIDCAMADVRLPKIFGDHMVLQRDKPVRIWGRADAGESVRVSLGGRTASSMADKSGKWMVEFAAMQAGGPYEIVVKGRNEVRLRDVLFGDLWLCGGQSNMQWTVVQTDYVEQDTTFINTADIRLYQVYIEMDYMPRDDVKGSGWMKLSTENINAFSAVAYHFGNYIHRELGVPIGLISDNLGATSVETWMSNEALLAFPQFRPVIGPVVKAGKYFAELERDFAKRSDRWYKRYYHDGIGMDQKWYRPETELYEWRPITASGNTWEHEPELKDHDGAVWFRTTFDLPPAFAADSFRLALSQIDDYDIAWVNGRKVGETYGKHNHRNYNVPRSILRDTGNVLVIRVFDIGGIGGFTTNPFWGNEILRGQWIYRKGAVLPKNFPVPFLPNATPFSSPGVLFNGCIAPLAPLRIRGVIWYQGESNADRAYEYRSLFPALIKDWRRLWNDPSMPFLFVQLANYGEESKQPQESTWAELREAQAMALTLEQTGMATAIDIGEANDIHPKNKQEVGVRLGRVAMNVAYGKELIASGPVYKSLTVTGDKAIIEFTNAGKGLITKDKYGYVRGFQIAGADGKFYWAKASIEANAVEVVSEQVRVPVAVRYAWDNNPGALDLYNSDGLPALPFRTDSWSYTTEGVVFRDGPRF